MEQGITFDFLTSVRFGLCLAMCFVFGYYIVGNIIDLRFKEAIRRSQAVIAFFIYEVGETIWRGFVWWNQGHVSESFVENRSYLIVAGSIAAIGSLCCLRVMLPKSWTWPTWVTVALFVSVMTIYGLSFIH